MMEDDDDDDNLGNDDDYYDDAVIDPAMADGRRMRDSNLAVKSKQNYQSKWIVVANYLRTNYPTVAHPTTNDIIVNRFTPDMATAFFWIRKYQT